MEQAEKEQTTQRPKGTPVGRQTLAEVDAGLSECDKVIKSCSDAVKARLGGTGSIPPQLLRDLSRANVQRGKLMMRRISLLTESGVLIAEQI